ncbi:hypothetical protein T01_1647 [Trichinella spiralis]|uniref:Uncharacterized protein n=1 Tax=Trichinella spiralis TaxID=6334 RepID=A0A0V1B2B2_TRISP|nr:hypothetical protein T01_1647 [Trichinella spiralis]
MQCSECCTKTWNHPFRVNSLERKNSPHLKWEESVVDVASAQEKMTRKQISNAPPAKSGYADSMQLGKHCIDVKFVEIMPELI